MDDMSDIELRPLPDQTVAGMAPGAETEILAVDYPPTGRETLEAWSAVDDAPDPVVRSWGSVWGVAGVLLGMAAVAALLIGVVGWFVVVGSHRGDVPVLPAGDPTPTLMPATSLPPLIASTTEAAPKPVAAPSVPTKTVTMTAAAPPAAQQLRPDDLFIQRLKAHQITVYNPTQAVAGAAWVCTLMRDGSTTTNAIVTVQTREPAFTDQGAIDYVAASIDIYCPQYGGTD
jgi:hypothetical protein